MFPEPRLKVHEDGFAFFGHVFADCDKAVFSGLADPEDEGLMTLFIESGAFSVQTRISVEEAKRLRKMIDIYLDYEAKK